jgi:small-conductance mechanosensitive channel
VVDCLLRLTPRTKASRKSCLALCIAVLSFSALSAQFQPRTAAQAPPATSLDAIGAEPAGETFTFTFANRQIVVLRARVLGRRPVERAGAVERALDELLADGIAGPVTSRPFDGGVFIDVGTRTVLAVTPPDVEELSGETLQQITAQAVTRLQQALAEASEARSVSRMLRSAASAAAGLALGLALLWGLVHVRRAADGKLAVVAEQRLAKAGIADRDALRASRVLEFQHGLITAATAALGLVVVYATVTFVLRRFPYTRPWGESMRGFLVTTIEDLGLGIANAIPGLFTIALILVLTRFLIRLVGLWFQAIERGRIQARWIYPETAQPTRRLVTGLLWLFAIVVAYPYMPGSQTDAFKGVSVFLGLMITLGSSGLVNHIMSGFMLTYSRAVRLGDFVRIGDVEGTVTHLGVLSVKVRTPFYEEVTIPNAVVVSQTTTDYSRYGDAQGVFTPTSVTIGYDAPWRQVQELLLLAAERTPGLRREPKPKVLQEALQDFYVKYTLIVCLERQESRPFTLHALHAHIQDLFNEYGVQIMSPNYVLDPAAPKMVPKTQWFATPARPDSPQSGS